MTKHIETIKRFSGRGVCPYQMASSLTNPLRRLILSPEELATRLALDDGFRVLELGAGPGYFSVEAARNIPHGHLVLLDIQFEMLEMARARLDKAGVKNVAYVQADGGALPVCDETFDVVFLVTVLGEMPDPRACLHSIYRALRPGGLFSNTEQPGDPDFMRFKKVRMLAEEQGFQFVERFNRGKNYTVNLRKPIR